MEENKELGRYSKGWCLYDIDYGYDKQEYDIWLKTGKWIFNCYPNAGKFTSFNIETDSLQFNEKEIFAIRLSETPILGING